MPGFGETLSDREIHAVLAYIKSRWPEQIRERQEMINARSR
jgi:mono/diheme cytochrome c family protein